MAHRAKGRYTLTAVAVGAEAVQGPAAAAGWTWRGRQRTPVSPTGPVVAPPAPPATHHHHHHAAVTPPLPTPPGPPLRIRDVIKHLRPDAHGGAVPFAIVTPKPSVDRAGSAVAAAVQGVVQAVGQAGHGTGFPLVLLALVVMFLFAQNLIDRRDPKLAMASIAADDLVEFKPPPSRRDRP
jgi:hypothetical protein